jgi:hypothetical protein
VLNALCVTGQAQNLSEAVNIDSIKVGDTFNYSIILDRNQEYSQVNFPDSTEFGSVFEIRTRKQFKLSTFKDSISYQLQFFGTADTTIPQLPVRLIQDQDTTILYTNPVPVRFNSVLAAQDSTFRPLKPIFDFAAAWWPYILGLLILLALAYYLYKYYTKEEEEEPKEQRTFVPTPFVNPIHELQNTITRLEQMELSSPEDFKTFYIELGDGIREYFESLYKIPALESTSRELLNMLNMRAIDEDLVADIKAVLQEADMVKFAKFTPTNKQAERALDKSHNFLERARSVDGPRVEHLRRKHHTDMEAERRQFYDEQEKPEEVNA